MAYLSDFMSSNNPRGTQAGGPGSNGYWRREIFNRPGTHTWTARKRGRVKIQGVGAAASGAGTFPGPSGAFGEKELVVEAGQTLTFVVGAGGARPATNNAPANSAGTSSVSGPVVGGTPLTLVGAQGNPRVAGTASGPWDISHPGAVPSAANTGGPSSGSPFGPGNVSTGGSGAGWGGGALVDPVATHIGPASGGSTHNPSIGAFQAIGFQSIQSGMTFPWWDMRDADSHGGISGTVGSQNDVALPVGIGAGTAASGYPAPSPMGGGTGRNHNSNTGNGAPGGYGAGGGAAQSTNYIAGRGGDAIFILFFDEVNS